MAPRPSLKLVALLVLGAVGLVLVAVGVGTTAGWGLVAPGVAALVISLVGVWRIQRERDRKLW
jgi:CHASE2 domain-containing sensor protein